MSKRVAVVVLLLFAAACGGKSKTPATSSIPSPTATRPPIGDGQSNRPLSGVYVYTLTSTSGPSLPAGFERIETVSSSGDKYTDVIGDNKNSNRVTYTRAWSTTGLTLVASDAVASNGERRCAYQPAIKVVPLPLKTQTLPRQNWSSPDLACTGSTDVSVVSHETVKDAKGTSWSTWKIIETTTSGGGTSTQTHWFSPLLGVDVRDQSASSAQTTLSVLRDYPS